MLGSSAQNQYCQIFSFLLQIKAAKYLLDQLQFVREYNILPLPLFVAESIQKLFLFCFENFHFQLV